MSVKNSQLLQGSADTSWKNRYQIGFWLVLLLVTAGVWAPYVRFYSFTDLSASLSTYWQGAETGVVYRPFAYRVLLPLMAAIAERVFPLPPMLYNDIFIFFCIFGFADGFRALAHHFWEPSRILDYIVLLSIPLIIPFTLVYPHIYDMPMLCLSTWCIVFLAQKRWRAFLICYMFACFNKETTLFFTFMFVACYAQEYKSSWFQRLLAMQLGIYVPIRISLMYIFRDFPGGAFESYFWYHIAVYLGDPLKACFYMVVSGFVAALLFYKLRLKPLFLRKALFSVLPIIIALYLPLGFPYEFRIFYDVYAPLLLLCIPPQYVQPRAYYP